MKYTLKNNPNLKSLDIKVDYVRELLYTLLNYKHLTHKQVINCSQYLDKLILRYEKPPSNNFDYPLYK